MAAMESHFRKSRGRTTKGASRLTAVIALDPLDEFHAEQTSGPHQKKTKRDDVGEPDLDPAAEKRADINFGELFSGAYQQSADDRPEDRIEAAKNKNRQRLENDEGQRELHAQTGAPEEPGNQRDDAGGGPHDRPDHRQPKSNRKRGELVV